VAAALALFDLAAGVIITVGGCHQQAPTRSNEATVPWRVVEQISLANGYEVVTSLDAGRSAKRLDIRRHGLVEWSSTEFSDEPGYSKIILPARSGIEPLLAKLDQDITHDGIPNLVIREYTGGGHCCTVDHIFSLDPDGLAPYQEIDYGHGSFQQQHFVQAEREGELGIVTEDWTFAYWKLSFAESPAPAVLLRLKGSEQCGRLRWVFGNTKKVISQQQWEAMREDARRRNAMPGGSTDSESLPGLLSNTLDLIYTGNASLARSYVDLACRGHESRQIGFLVELGLRLKTSEFLDGVIELNEVDTIGQLLAGDEGLFGN